MTDIEQLSHAYYQPEHLWMGRKAITQLMKILPKISRKQVKQWLAKQAMWQIHIPPPKHIIHPHYQVDTPNQLHEMDLLYMPHDTLYQTKYKYILTMIDVASRFKVARPLQTKKPKEVVEMIADIYKKGPLKWPVEIQIDNGTEFKADVTKLYEKQGVKIRRATTKYNHTYTASVENLNKQLAKLLFKQQDAVELNDPEKCLNNMG